MVSTLLGFSYISPTWTHQNKTCISPKDPSAQYRVLLVFLSIREALSTQPQAPAPRAAVVEGHAVTQQAMEGSRQARVLGPLWLSRIGHGPCDFNIQGAFIYPLFSGGNLPLKPP